MARFAYEDGAVVVIIGSGAGGGTLAHELTRRGIKVVLLEAGKRESPASFVQNPGQAFGMLTWNDARSQSGDWTVARDFPTLPAWHCKTLGGTTVHWTAASLRLQSWELKARSHYGPVAGARLIDWPVPYAHAAPLFCFGLLAEFDLDDLIALSAPVPLHDANRGPLRRSRKTL